MTILAIDPGNVESAWALIDPEDWRPLSIGKAPNAEVRRMLTEHAFQLGGATWELVAIEMIASYGMTVGREVFDTVWEAARFAQIVDPRDAGLARRIYRSEVKLHLCGSNRAKDSNIAQALVDRFAPGQPNKGKGTKAKPGWFYGFRADIWAAYAIAVYVADTSS